MKSFIAAVALMIVGLALLDLAFRFHLPFLRFLEFGAGIAVIHLGLHFGKT